MVMTTHVESLRRFYASLAKQKPDSKMAVAWLLKNGFAEDLLPIQSLQLKDPGVKKKRAASVKN